MSSFLFQYRGLDPATWVYLSSLLMIGLFFKFSRCWSVRNLDMVLLILLAPGLLLIHNGQEQQRLARQGELLLDDQPGMGVEAEPPSAADTAAAVRDDPAHSGAWDPRRWEVLGFAWLFGVGGLLLARLLFDPLMVRRPLLEPNLSLGGLTFIGCALFVFLMANIVAEPAGGAVESAGTIAHEIVRFAPASNQGPGYALLSILPANLVKSLCIASHLAVIVGMSLIGYWHFGNLVMGIGAAVVYLMLPYTAFLTGRIDHVLPAALLVWAVLWYRNPLVSGSLVGLASGIVYYPFFLLPLWLSFYWQRGCWRFVTGFAVTLALLASVLIASPNGLVEDAQRMFGLWTPVMDGLRGIWNPDAGGLETYFRLPVLVAFAALSISFALWPAQKNLGTLLSCSAAVMVSAQFWHGYGGGTYMAWYLPLTLLTIFRPNLEDRVAVTVLSDGWIPHLRGTLPKAA